MKALQLVLFTSLCLFLASAIRAQVKIGDNPLDIGTERLLEIERANELFIITDSLEMGITNNNTSNLTADALMIKLFGYGLGQFTPGSTGTSQSYFLGTNTGGEVLEFPLSLDLITSSSPNTATLSLNNGTATFGSVDLTNLDSIFATDNALIDSINTLRNLVALSEASDGDTITGNEWIAQIDISGDPTATMTIYENTTVGGNTSLMNQASVSLGLVFTTDVEFGDTLITIRNELADTAETLRQLIEDSNIYTADGTLDEDRVMTGANFDLTISGIDSFGLQANSRINLDATTDLKASGDDAVTITADEDADDTGDLTLATGAQTVMTVETDEDVLFSSSSLDSTLYLDSDGTVKMEDYGAGNNLGGESYILGVTPDGTLVDVDVTTIGGNATLSSPVDLDENGTLETTVDEAIQAANVEIDSTIYNYDGTLDENRTLSGATNTLTFDNVSTFALTTMTSFDVDATNVDLDGTNYTADYTTSTITTTGTNTVTSSGADVAITAGTVVDVNGNTVDIDATSGVTIDGSDATITTSGATTINATGAVDIDGAAITVDGSSIAETSTSTIDLDAATDLTASGDDAVTITADEDADDTGDLTLATGAQTVMTVETDEDVLFSSSTTDSTLYIDSDGTVKMEDYGAGNNLGGESYILGVTPDGTLVDVDVTTIGGDATLSSPVDLDENGTLETTVDEAIQAANVEIDSTIYNYDGTLDENRTLSGATNTLTFDNVSTFALTTMTSFDVDATNVDLDGTNYTADYTTSTITTTGTNTVTSSGADVAITAGTVVDVNGNTVDIDATSGVTIDGSDATITTSGATTINATGAVDIDGAAITVDGSSIAETSTSTIDLDAATDLTASGDDAVTITADEDADDTGDLTLATGAQTVMTVETDEDVLFSSSSLDSTLYLDSDGTVKMEDYGAGNNLGGESYILGVTPDGTLVDVDVTTIGGDATLSSPVDLDENGTLETTVDEAIQAANVEIDSTIYNYDGTLTGERTMSMDGNNLYFVGTSNDTVVITNDGRIGVNTGSFTPNSVTSDVKLEVNGDILAVQMHSSSDVRFKKNIELVSDALDKVKKINGVNYQFRTEEFPNRSFPATKQLGFIAQDVEATVPEVVMTDGQGYKAVDYSKLTALLNEAIKQQQNQIENLSNQLAEVRKENQFLYKEIADIKSMMSRKGSKGITE